jgi:hypothetical protein
MPVRAPPARFDAYPVAKNTRFGVWDRHARRVGVTILVADLVRNGVSTE